VSRAAGSGLSRRIALVQRWLMAIYRLDLPLHAERFLLTGEAARRLLPAGSPRSGLAVVEEGEDLWLGLYLDPRDRPDVDTVVEETSHWVCLVWHAAQGRPVSQLQLELQGEVDRYAVARLSGCDGLRHFRDFRWVISVDAATRDRYETAHRTAYRYCRFLAQRYPQRTDVPGLLAELRGFYRASAQARLRFGFS
jgi:hypothetical protein